MMSSLRDAPDHVWNSISFVAYITSLCVISAVGMALGYPQVLWVWAVFCLLGWESDECSCADCTGKEHPENKEPASEVLKRKYVNNEIDEQELDKKLEDINRIDKESEEIDKSLQLN